MHIYIPRSNKGEGHVPGEGTWAGPSLAPSLPSSHTQCLRLSRHVCRSTEDASCLRRGCGGCIACKQDRLSGKTMPSCLVLFFYIIDQVSILSSWIAWVWEGGRLQYRRLTAHILLICLMNEKTETKVIIWVSQVSIRPGKCVLLGGSHGGGQGKKQSAVYLIWMPLRYLSCTGYVYCAYCSSRPHIGEFSYNLITLSLVFNPYVRGAKDLIQGTPY